MFDTAAYDRLFDSIGAVLEHRAGFLSEIGAGSLMLKEVFVRAAHDPVLHTMKVLPAIEALPEAGKVSTRRAFGELGISETALIRDVPTDAIEALAGAIARHTRTAQSHTGQSHTGQSHTGQTR